MCNYMYFRWSTRVCVIMCISGGLHVYVLCVFPLVYTCVCVCVIMCISTGLHVCVIICISAGLHVCVCVIMSSRVITRNYFDARLLR